MDLFYNVMFILLVLMNAVTLTFVYHLYTEERLRKEFLATMPPPPVGTPIQFPSNQ